MHRSDRLGNWERTHIQYFAIDYGTTALFFFFITLQNIPLASAMTIQHLSPIFTSIIAIFVPSERVRPLEWMFYSIAFGGVLLSSVSTSGFHRLILYPG